MVEVTVVGVGGVTVSIPFTTSQNYVLAQYGAAAGISPLPDSGKFSFVTSATSVVGSGAGNQSGSSVVGTGAGASVIAGGTGVFYAASANNQSVFFSATGSGNILANNGTGTQYYVDAGGTPGAAGTTINTTVGSATIAAYSGYLNVVAGVGGTRINDSGAGVSTTLQTGAGVSIYAAGASVPVPQVTVVGSGVGSAVSSDLGVAIQLPAPGAVSVSGFGAGTDTITAPGIANIGATAISAIVNQTGAGNVSLSTNSGARVTVNAASGATETVAYTGAEGFNLATGGSDSLALTGGFIPQSFSVNIANAGNTINAAGSAGASLRGTSAGAATLTGGTFITAGASAPVLTAAGTTTIYSPLNDPGVAFALASGAAVSAFGSGLTTTDTITALGAGSVTAGTENVIVNQTGAGNLFLNEINAGLITVNAAAGATESLTAPTTPGIAVTYGLTGGNFNITGNRPTVNASGADTVSYTGPAGSAAIVNVAAGAKVTLAGGNFFVNSAGAGAGVALGANDTVTFAAAVSVPSVLGATTLGLSSSTGYSFDTVPASGTYILSGTPPTAAYHILAAQSTSNTIYFGTPYVTDPWGNVVESFNGSLLGPNNIVVWGGTGSQTLFGGGSAQQFGVGNQFYGGTAGKNLLVGAYTIVGGGAGDTLVGGTFTQSIVASAGNTTLIAGGSNSAGIAPANETLVGLTGNNTFIFGAGNATITGGPASDAFEDLNRTTTGTTITITDFTTSTGTNPDKVDLFSLTNAAGSGATANVSGQTVVSGATQVVLSDGVTIRFAGVTAVTANDFVTNVGTVQVGKVT